MNCPKCGEPITKEFAAKVLRSLKSEKRTKASAENGKLGGRPKLQRDPAGRTCPVCAEELGETIPLDVNGTCHGCGSCYGHGG